MMRWSAALFGILGAVVGGAIVWIAHQRSLTVDTLGVSYPDLIAVMLTGISVLLAIMGIGIAIGAFWGWQQFKGLTQKAAGEKALEHLRSDLGKSELLEVVEEISIGFLQAKLRDGTLLGLAEQRNKEKDKFSEVDDAWGDL